mmetsp:Transcript_34602/g.58245  ORF Transcript_34602/g.58245 Transcript_34602/m.58245 type:complete len:207 (+) Transcript_34602:1040-1660(+)
MLKATRWGGAKKLPGDDNDGVTAVVVLTQRTTKRTTTTARTVKSRKRRRRRRRRRWRGFAPEHHSAVSEVKHVNHRCAHRHGCEGGAGELRVQKQLFLWFAVVGLTLVLVVPKGTPKSARELRPDILHRLGWVVGPQGVHEAPQRKLATRPHGAAVSVLAVAVQHREQKRVGHRVVLHHESVLVPLVWVYWCNAFIAQAEVTPHNV